MKTLKTISLAAAMLWSVAFVPSLRAAGPADPSTRLLRDASLMLLREGNARFAAGKAQHPHQDAERRTATAAQGQEPIATILACSDSRDPVELIFDRGVGDLFVVRVAGNVAGFSELATVEYGVGHLNTPLLIVMGHTKCGAVTAVAKGAELHGHLQALAEKIKPAVAKVKAESPEIEEAVPKAIQANVWQTIEDILKQSSAVRAKVEAGQVSILGAIYDLEQGKVAWLGAHPAQDALIALAAQAETDAALARKLTAPTDAAKGSAPAKHAPAAPIAKTDDHSLAGHGTTPSGGGPKPH
jgi:carbonic anhydrase